VPLSHDAAALAMEHPSTVEQTSTTAAGPQPEKFVHVQTPVAPATKPHGAATSEPRQHRLAHAWFAGRRENAAQLARIERSSVEAKCRDM
jgi:hypothetical protein